MSMPPAIALPQPRSAEAPSWRRLRRNALTAFPPEAFEEEVVLRAFMGRQQFVVSRPEAIRHILVDNTDNYIRSRVTIRILEPLLGHGLFIAAGDEWRRQRRAVAPAFAPRMVPVFARAVAEAAGAHIAALSARDGEPIDLLAAMQELALAVAGRSLLSLDIDCGPQLRRLIRFYGDWLSRPGYLDVLLPLAVPSPRDLARALFRRRWMGAIRRLVEERRAQAGPADRADLFSLIAGEALTPQEVVEQVATMIVAGHETTAAALFWALYLVAEAPAAQAAIAAEAAALDLGPEGAVDALSHLGYTRAVVHEALRLYPPAFTIVRQAIAADDAGGIAIPSAGVVMISPWVLHRHRRLWGEPERFDPGRFLPGAPAPDRFAYLPFGIGPRVCIGAQFALTEAVLALALIVRAFLIERVDDAPVIPAAVVLTQPDPPPWFRLRAR
jgi:cytochrome P450